MFPNCREVLRCSWTRIRFGICWHSGTLWLKAGSVWICHGMISFFWAAFIQYPVVNPSWWLHLSSDHLWCLSGTFIPIQSPVEPSATQDPSARLYNPSQYPFNLSAWSLKSPKALSQHLTCSVHLILCSPVILPDSSEVFYRQALSMLTVISLSFLFLTACYSVWALRFQLLSQNRRGRCCSLKSLMNSNWVKSNSKVIRLHPERCVNWIGYIWMNWIFLKLINWISLDYDYNELTSNWLELDYII